MAQLVEHNLAKVGVAGSNPVVRSRCSADESAPEGALSYCPGTVPGGPADPVAGLVAYGARVKAAVTLAQAAGAVWV